MVTPGTDGRFPAEIGGYEDVLHGVPLGIRVGGGLPLGSGDRIHARLSSPPLALAPSVVRSRHWTTTSIWTLCLRTVRFCQSLPTAGTPPCPACSAMMSALKVSVSESCRLA